MEWWDVGISTRHQRGSGVNTRLGFLSARYSIDLSTSLSDPGQRAEALPWPWQEGYTEYTTGASPRTSKRVQQPRQCSCWGCGMRVDALLCLAGGTAAATLTCRVRRAGACGHCAQPRSRLAVAGMEEGEEGSLWRKHWRGLQ